MAAKVEMRTRRVVAQVAPRRMIVPRAVSSRTWRWQQHVEHDEQRRAEQHDKGPVDRPVLAVSRRAHTLHLPAEDGAQTSASGRSDRWALALVVVDIVVDPEHLAQAAAVWQTLEGADLL